jgi:hypothetical protein
MTMDVCVFCHGSLYPFRSGQGKQNAKARAKAIRKYCSWCMGDYRPSDCVVSHCPLFCYRKYITERPVLPEKEHIRHSFEEQDAMECNCMG